MMLKGLCSLVARLRTATRARKPQATSCFPPPQSVLLTASNTLPPVCSCLLHQCKWKLKEWRYPSKSEVSGFSPDMSVSNII